MRFTHAILRVPGQHFAQGLSSAGEGPPDLERALEQHAAYADALRACGLQVEVLPADLDHPDSCFVEDPAIVTEAGALLTRPGAPSRLGEVVTLRPVLERYVGSVSSIEAPGLLDGGDVCDLGGRFLIGLSGRTNAEGAGQLSRWLEERGYQAETVDLADHPRLLHLKTGISAIDEGRVVTVPGFPAARLLDGMERIEVEAGEEYAANCIRVNDRVLVPAGYPRLMERLEGLGYQTLPLPMSEFRRMDGGLSCLSLRLSLRRG
ncbi:MAG: dimethylarginine dimethylaminohydrolase family protein [Steroidobacteraceae bacterium]